MGFVFADLVVETILEEGLAYMRANPTTVMPDLYSQLKESYLNTQYGQDEIDRFTTYISNNKISIVQSWRSVQERVPCIYIQTIGGPEDESKSYLNDFDGNIDVIGGNQITSRHEQKAIHMQNAIQIGIHVDDPGGMTALRWLFAATMYFCLSNKDTMRDRGLTLTSLQFSDFNRLNELLPENIHSRYLTLNFKTEVTWKNLTAEPMVHNIDMHGGPGASTDPDSKKGGIRARAGQDPDYEEDSFYTIGQDT